LYNQGERINFVADHYSRKPDPMSEVFQPVLRGFIKTILSLLSQLALLLVARIKDTDTRLMVQGFLQGTSKTIEALGDSNPNDKEQIQAIFNDLFEDGPFKTGSQTKLLALAGKVKDEDAKLFLSISVNQAYPVADLLTDSDPDNAEQIKEQLRQLLRSQDGLIFLQSFLGIILPDSYADIAALTVLQLLRDVLEEEGETLLVKQVAELQQARQARLLQLV